MAEIVVCEKCKGDTVSFCPSCNEYAIGETVTLAVDKKGRCPACKSDDVTFHDQEQDIHDDGSGYIVLQYFCNRCGAHGGDVYALTYQKTENYE